MISAAAASSAASLDWPAMLLQLFGGLAIFLLGMEQMASALKQVAGMHMKDILSRVTGSRLRGVLTGAMVTAVIQSSSVTTVILVGFVASGLLSLAQAVGIILGANIGTTVTAQIIAFKVTRFALAFVAGGFLMSFAGRSGHIRYYGKLIMGLGMIFFGMNIMSAGMQPLRGYAPFIEMMSNVSNPAVGILVAAAFTALVQSSSATLGVIISLALQGLVTLEGGIALALGANIGTCVTAALAAIGKPREAMRVAVAHVAFNVVGVLLIVWFIGPFAELVRALSPAAPELAGAARLAAETPRQIANAHTLFNVVAALVFLPFLAPFARLCERLVPDRPLDEGGGITPRFLDDEVISIPAFALERARFEIARMGEYVEDMLRDILPLALTGSADDIEKIAERDTLVDRLYAKIVHYLGAVSVEALSPQETDYLMRLFDIAERIEDIGDVIETRMVTLGLRRIDDQVFVSPGTLQHIERVHDMVLKAYAIMLDVIRDQDREKLAQLEVIKHDLDRLTEGAARHEVERLMVTEPNRLKTFSREVEAINHLRDIFRQCRRIAKKAIPPEPDEAS
jgi:phosphate:Na+ symporter